jgi:hypothetical protein
LTRFHPGHSFHKAGLSEYRWSSVDSSPGRSWVIFRKTPEFPTIFDRSTHNFGRKKTIVNARPVGQRLHFIVALLAADAIGGLHRSVIQPTELCVANLPGRLPADRLEGEQDVQLQRLAEVPAGRPQMAQQPRQARLLDL